MSKITSFFAILLAVAGCAGEAVVGDEGIVNLDGEGLSPRSEIGKADGSDDITSRSYRGGDLVTLYGPSAANLWDIMEEGGVAITPQRGLEYAYGQNMVCVTNRSAAACQLFSRDFVKNNGDFAFTIHGPRFSSAASELFGTMAAANGVSARSTTSLRNGAFVCAKDARTVWCGLEDNATPTPTPSNTTILSASFEGLGDLGEDYVYEGWLITPEGPITGGRFNLADGNVFDFEVPNDIIGDISMYVLTIEPKFNDDPAPADTHVVAGVFRNGDAVLTTDHPAALNTDFANATGSYFLQTPSSADPDDYNLGIWFMDPAAGVGSLDLPTLPAGWVYEGWVVGDSGPVSTGTFVDANAADSDFGGPTAGPLGTPPVPGQDFINPPMDLVGTTIVISVEPSPDNSPAPFFLKPLVDGDAVDLGPGVLQSMGNNAAATAITGFATFN